MTSENQRAVEFYNQHGDDLTLAWDEDRVDSILPDVSGRDVLDAGCGHGAVGAELANRGASVTGIDASQTMVSSARERHGDVVSFVAGALAEGLPFADESFDIAVSTLVLAHIESWPAVFQEFHRVLRDGGYVVLHTNHPFFDYLELERGSDAVRQSDPVYERIERFERAWGPGGEAMPFYRRPLGDAIGAMLDAGFVLDTFIEPESDGDGPPRYLLLRGRA